MITLKLRIRNILLVLQIIYLIFKQLRYGLCPK